MSKKHYNKFAELIKKYQNDLPKMFIAEFTVILKEDNERFDFERFSEAIMPQ